MYLGQRLFHIVLFPVLHHLILHRLQVFLQEIINSNTKNTTQFPTATPLAGLCIYSFILVISPLGGGVKKKETFYKFDVTPHYRDCQRVALLLFDLIKLGTVKWPIYIQQMSIIILSL